MRLVIIIAASLLHGEANAADMVTLSSSLYYSALQEDYAAGEGTAFRDSKGKGSAAVSSLLRATAACSAEQFKSPGPRQERMALIEVGSR